MARTLSFKLAGKEFSAPIERVDRKKLYGWTEVLALDDEGNDCKLANMDESGTVIIPSKGTALGNLAPDGKWVDKSELMAVNPDGTPASLIPSSYKDAVELKDTATVEEYLGHAISACYQLEGLDADIIKKLSEAIYTFEYSYSDAYDASSAFLIENAGKVFMLVGTPTNFEMIGLEETSVVDEGTEEEEEESDSFDFGSMF